MEKIGLGAIVSVAMALGCPEPATAESFNLVSSGLTGNPKTSFQSRRAFGGAMYNATANRTFITWNGPNMDPYVQAYNHATSQWETAVKIGNWNDGSTYAYHDYSTLFMMPNGKPAVIQFDHSTSASLFIAPNANSISGTWTRSTISTDRTAYPMPVVVGSTIYLFYSRNDDINWPYRTYRVIKSTDNGATWENVSTPGSTASTVVLDTGKTSDKFNEIYAYSFYVSGSKIYITFALQGGAVHNERGKNLYAIYFDTSNNQIYSVTGTPLGTTVTQSEFDNCIVVTSLPPTTGTADELHPITYSQFFMTEQGMPFIGYGETIKGVGKYIRYAKLVNNSWVTGTVASGTAEFNDMTRSGDDEFEFVYTDDFVPGSPTAGVTQYLIASRVNNAGASVTPLYSLDVNFGGTNANRIVNANFVTSRQNIRVVGTMVHDATKMTDYTGRWPVFAVRQ